MSKRGDFKFNNYSLRQVVSVAMSRITDKDRANARQIDRGTYGVSKYWH